MSKYVIIYFSDTGARAQALSKRSAKIHNPCHDNGVHQNPRGSHGVGGKPERVPADHWNSEPSTGCEWNVAKRNRTGVLWIRRWAARCDKKTPLLLVRDI